MTDFQEYPKWVSKGGDPDDLVLVANADEEKALEAKPSAAKPKGK